MFPRNTLWGKWLSGRLETAKSIENPWGSSAQAQHRSKQALPGTNLMLLGFVWRDHSNVSWIAPLPQQRCTGGHH